MSDKGNSLGPASRILRERAMAVLRETRAKINPDLLMAMKDHLSAAMPQEPVAAPKKETVFKREEPVPAVEAVLDSDMEPVDRQKIAQIVLQYMKNREDKQKH